MFTIIETSFENGQEIFLANQDWLKGGRLLWPPKNVKYRNQKVFLEMVPDNDWVEIEGFTVLQYGIETISEANKRLNFFCLYDNTRDKLDDEEAKRQKRLHPVNYTENNLDYNSLFDDLLKKSNAFTSTPNSTLAITEKIKCGLCGGENGVIECKACSSDIFCEDCDFRFHKHPLRNKHVREKTKRTVLVEKTDKAKQKNTKTATCVAPPEIDQTAGNLSRTLALPPPLIPIPIQNREKELREISMWNNIPDAGEKKQTNMVRSNKSKPAKQIRKAVTSGATCKKKSKKSKHNSDEDMGSASDDNVEVNSNKDIKRENISDAVTTKKQTIINVELTCYICGLSGQVKCDSCFSLIFCGEWDIRYHTNTTRKNHIRQKIVSPSSSGLETVYMMDEICQLRQEIVELEESLGQRQSQGRNPFRDRSSSLESNREWRYERARGEGQNNENQNDHSDMPAHEWSQERDIQRNGGPRKRCRESKKDRQKRFERVRDILRREERNRLKRQIVVKLLQRIDAVSLKQRRTFNSEIRDLRYQLLYISTPSENVRDGRRYYRI